VAPGGKRSRTMAISDLMRMKRRREKEVRISSWRGALVCRDTFLQLDSSVCQELGLHFYYRLSLQMKPNSH